eukprot:scaffold45188_cov33-Attheya_sp.AAC.1
MEREVATEPSNDDGDDGDDGDDHLSIMTGRSPRPHIDKVTVTNDESYCSSIGTGECSGCDEISQNNSRLIDGVEPESGWTSKCDSVY